MQSAGYLLANAFRINQTQAPDKLPTVQAYKALKKELDVLEKAVKKGDASGALKSSTYAVTLWNEYLKGVELDVPLAEDRGAR